MPLEKNRLGMAMAKAIKDSRPDEGEAITDLQLENMWVAVADQIISEIKTNATVTTTVTVTTPAGPGTGTGRGTIS